MELTGIGGGLMVAIAAALWLVYLVPNWFKRREYLATERNAVRLQQTIRVLAETAEIPRAVRAEAAARAIASRPADAPVAVGRPVAPEGADVRYYAARRSRRTRRLTTTLLLGALVIALVQVAQIATTGAVAGSWLVLAGAGLAALCAVAMLRRLAEVSRARSAAQPRSVRRTSLGAAQPRAAQRRAQWTPVPVPKPLYLSRPEAEAAPIVDPQFELELAAASAERALRGVNREIPSVRPTPEVVPAAAPSRFATMGIVDAASTAAPDLDAVLARRRAAG